MTIFKTEDFTIITCNCYSYQWSQIKYAKDESWKFDEIEKGKESFRKFFYEKKSIFHCCEDCLEKSIKTNPFTVNSTKPVGYCLLLIARGKIQISQVCDACIWFFVEKFNRELFDFY